MNFFERNQFIITMLIILVLGIFAFQEKSLVLLGVMLGLAVLAIIFKIYLNLRATKQNRK